MKFIMTAESVKHYGREYDGVTLTVIHEAYRYMPAAEFYARGMPTGYHPGYDDGAGGTLYDLALPDGTPLPFSLYDWELTDEPEVPIDIDAHNVTLDEMMASILGMGVTAKGAP